MLNDVLKNIVRFVLLVLVQVLLLNNIQLSGYINPYLYVLFILMLPFEIPGWLLLLVSLATGLTIDMFTNTAGMHAGATVFLGFLRPYLLRLIAPRDGYEFGTFPSIKHLGFSWFITYAAILIFFHHLALFYLEVFRLSEFFRTFFRAFASSIFTLALVIVTQYLFTGSKARQ